MRTQENEAEDEQQISLQSGVLEEAVTDEDSQKDEAEDEQHKRSKGTMDTCCTTVFKRKILLYPCFQGPAYQNSLQPENQYSIFKYQCSVYIIHSCSAKYFFKRKREPVGDTQVRISVQQSGKIMHKTSERKFRPATNTRRGTIARALHKGVSQFRYNKLHFRKHNQKSKQKCSESDYFRGQKSEKYSQCFMEMYLTQNIMKECDAKFHKMPGYIQHFQVDPFGLTLYVY